MAAARGLEGAAGDRGPARPTGAGVAAMGRWREGAEAFVALLLEMRAAGAGGRFWADGLRRLMEDPPEASMYVPAGPRTQHMGLAALLQELLADLHSAASGEGARPRALRQLLRALERRALVVCRRMGPASDWGELPEVAGKLGFGGLAREAGNRLVPLVGLPLALYVRNTPHLYTLLRRLRAPATSAAPVSVEALRGALDCDGRPYTVLAYAFVAALQQLLAVRRAGVDLAALAITAAPAPRGVRRGEGIAAAPWCEPEAPAKSRVHAQPGAAARGGAPAVKQARKVESELAAELGPLLFRGLWVPPQICEDSARCQWAPNSFSRCMEGVCHVLNFYGSCRGTPTAELAGGEDPHVLLLVARRSSLGPWAIPVQLFNGALGQLEKEVVLPPFVMYSFEEGLEISSTQEPKERMARLSTLQWRWKLDMSVKAPLLMTLLEGHRVLKVKNPIVPRVTVRFVRSASLAPEVERLLLMGAPPDEAAALGAATPAACSAAARDRELDLLAFPPEAPELVGKSEEVSSTTGEKLLAEG